ncbi:hypothetical protein [Streptomyces morookaense]|uniref:Transposase n=1 Tax=Streptomyces morookaense TaxID=1970 RepID=A0A7Y7B6S7_STRMO|nr:hypothetical protein [Streptomyces morookaense]NVK80047.1 hypothetical protein [Streptomyces morookaense]
MESTWMLGIAGAHHRIGCAASGAVSGRPPGHGAVRAPAGGTPADRPGAPALHRRRPARRSGPRWHVRWTPPHASWLNQAELFVSALTRRAVRHGNFANRDDLIGKLEAYVIGHNETAKPYRWTYEGTPLKAA